MSPKMLFAVAGLLAMVVAACAVSSRSGAHVAPSEEVEACFTAFGADMAAVDSPVSERAPLIVEIPSGPEARTQADFNRARIDWARRNVVDAYLKFAGDGGLNQRAAKFYADSMKVWMAVEVGPEFAAAAAKEGRALLAAGHAEPLTGFFLGLVLPDSERREAKILFQTAYDAVSKDPKYPPLLRFYVYDKALLGNDCEAARLRQAQSEEAFLQACAEGVFKGDDVRGACAILGNRVRYGDFSRASVEKLKTLGGDPWLYLCCVGQHELKLAWADRGGGGAATVTSTGWDGYGNHLEKARAALAEAWRLHPERPEPAAAMVEVCLGDHDGATLWFNRAVKAQMDSPLAYFTYLWSIWPRWCGSHAEMVAFGEKCLATGRYDTIAPYYYFLALMSVATDSPYCQWKAPFRAPGAIEKLEKLFEGSAHGSPWGDAEKFQYELALCELWAGRYEKAANLFAKIPANFDGSRCVWGVDRLGWVPRGRAESLAAIRAFTGPLKKEFLEADRLALAGESEWAAAALERLLPSLAQDKELSRLVQDEIIYLKLGTDAEGTRRDGRSAFHSALRQKNLKLMELALRFQPGTDISSKDAAGYTPLMSAIHRYDSVDMATVRFLLDHGANPNCGTGDNDWTPLYQSLWDDKLDLTKLLLEHGANPNQRVGGDPPLYYAIREGRTEAVRLMLRHGVVANVPPPGLIPPLSCAIKNKRSDIAQLLIDSGVDTLRVENGNSLLHVAAIYGDTDRVEYCLSHGFNVDVRNDNGRTALLVAAQWGAHDMAEFLLSKGADPNVADKDVFTPLYRAAGRGDARMARILLLHKADPNARNKDGMTALALAVNNGGSELVETLLAAGADIEARDGAGYTPFARAAFYGKLDSAELLLRHGANINAPDNQGNVPLLSAARRGDAKTVKFLLRFKPGLELRDAKGFTPLMVAAAGGRAEVVALLLAAGADPKSKDKGGRDAAALAELFARSSGDTVKAAEISRLLRLPVRRAPNY